MTFKALLRSVLLVAVATGLFACTGGDNGGGNTTSVITNSTDVITLKQGTVIIGSDDASEIIGRTLLSDGEVSISISNDTSLNDDLVVGNNLSILAGVSDQFPLGISGKIEEVAADGSGSKVTISPLKFAEVVDESSYNAPPIKLNADNLIGVIAPDAVIEATEQAALQNRAAVVDPSVVKSFLNGAVVVKRLSPQGKSFLGDAGVIEEDLISLDIDPISLKKMVDEPTNIRNINQSAEASVVVSGSIRNLVIEQNHDFKINEGLKSLKFRVSGDVDATVALTGEAEFTAGYFNKAWDQVKQAQYEMLGQSAEISGLESKDKFGKYPIAGLVFNVPCVVAGGSCPVVKGKDGAAITQAKAGGIIIWVYFTARGELTFTTQIGVQTSMKLTIGAEKKAGGNLTNLSSVKDPDEGRVLKAPFIEGKVNLTADLGFSIEADFFVAGVRPATAGADTIGRFLGGINTTKKLSYGVTKLGDDWSWEAGKVCLEASIGAGVILSSAFDFGYDVDIDVGFYQENVNGHPVYSGQWPEDDDILQSGWHGLGPGPGTWYTGSARNVCLPSLAKPVLAATVKDSAVALSWDEEEEVVYDLCYAKASIEQALIGRPLGCSDIGGVSVANVTPEYLVEGLDNDELYYFMLTAKYRYVVIELEREELAVSNQVTAMLETEVIPNQIPTVSLPPSSAKTHGQPFEVIPTVTDDKLFSVSYKWSVTWEGSNASLGSTSSVTDATLVLNIPTLASGESGSAIVTLEVTDFEGEVAADTSTYTYQQENVSPTLALPANGSINLEENKPRTYSVDPTVTDDVLGTLTYQWDVEWLGAKADSASTGSLTGTTLSLNIPSLEPGESGSVMVKLRVTDADGEFDDDSVTYTYKIDKIEALKFDGDDFTDGDTLERGSSHTLTWSVINAGNVDLTDVVLTLSETAGELTVGELSPLTVDTWPRDEAKTFTVTVDIPNDVVAGTHKQLWRFSHNDGVPLPYVGETVGAPLYFEFLTSDPSDLLGRLVINSKFVEPGDVVFGTAEVHSGNEPYTFAVDWGDGTDITSFPNITEDHVEGDTTYARQAIEHSYANDGIYNVTVNITDFAGKSIVPPLRDTITVTTSKITQWGIDVRDIDTSEHEENIAFTTESYTNSGVTAARYTTNWSPSVDPTSEEYFVKYRLPVPKNVLSLGKKIRIGASVQASGIAAHDREFAFRTQSGKEYSGVLIDIDHEEDGYMRKRDMLTDMVEITRYPALVDDVKDTKLANYSLTVESPKMSLWRDQTNTTQSQELASLLDGFDSEFVSEIDITFKGNGILGGLILQYDLNDDEVFTSNESILLNTVDRTVDWSALAEPAGLPDLVISSLTVASIENGEITFDYTLENIGSGVANLAEDGLRVHLFHSNDTTLNDADDIWDEGRSSALGSSVFGADGNLEPGESYQGYLTIPISGELETSDQIVDSEAMPYVILKVDAGEAVVESNEDNNTASIDKGLAPAPVALPDFIISSMAITSIYQYEGNDYFRIEFTIKNIGTGVGNLDGPTDAETDNIGYQFFHSADTIFNNAGDIAGGGSIIGLSPLGSLAPGESRDLTGSVAVEADFIGVTGDSTLLPNITMMIDFNNHIDESNEGNNTAWVSKNIGSLSAVNYQMVLFDSAEGSIVGNNYLTNEMACGIGAFGKDVNGNYSNDTNCMSDFLEGSELSFQAKPIDGYEFDKFMFTNCSESLSSASSLGNILSVTMSGNCAFTAIFK